MYAAWVQLMGTRAPTQWYAAQKTCPVDHTIQRVGHLIHDGLASDRNPRIQQRLRMGGREGQAGLESNMSF